MGARRRNRVPASPIRLVREGARHFGTVLLRQNLILGRAGSPLPAEHFRAHE